MSSLDLSIIILSYNTKNITGECLSRLWRAVSRCTQKLGNEIEVIVVDNASTDGSADEIKKNHSWVKLIGFKTNTGFSGGNNLGLKNATYPYVLFLNSDAYVEEDTLIKALEYFQKNPDCSVLGPKLVFDNGKLQPSAGNLPTPFNVVCWILGLSLVPGLAPLTTPFHPNYKEFFAKEREVGWIMGAFFMVKKEVIEKVGGFDEKIFMYLEEVEFCKRIKNGGFQVWYVPEIKVIHLHGASSNFDNSPAFIQELKGLKYYFGKYHQASYGVVRIFLVLGLVLRIIAFSLLGRTKRARAYVEALKLI